MNKLIESGLREKATWIMCQLCGQWPTQEFECYLAGGALAGPVNDVDLFPVTEIPEPLAYCLATTKNATTYDTKPHPLQICAYKKASLTELVESFDYAHIQVGAKIEMHKSRVSVQEVYCSEAYLAAHALGTTWFTGSAYPLSSLIRAEKYKSRGLLTRGKYIRSLIDVVTGIIERGFKNYEDFKDQLDAVDLGLLPDELEEVTHARLMRLYELLKR